MTILPLRRFLLAALWLVMGSPVLLPAFQHSENESLPALDKRKQLFPQARQAKPAREAAVEKLKNRVPGLRIGRDEERGSIRHVASTDGFLTGPDGEGKAVQAARARAFAVNDAHRSIKAFLDEHAGLFGHGAEVLRETRLRQDSVGRLNALRTVVWEQRLDDIAIYEGVLIGHVTGRGELVSLSSQMLPDAARAADLGTPQRAALEAAPTLSAARAVLIAAENIGEPLLPGDVAPLGGPGGNEWRQAFKAGPLPGAADTRLVWLPLNEGALRLCWQVELTRRAGGERQRVVLDARSGEVFLRRCLTLYAQPASFRVFTGDSPTPFSPGWSQPNSNQPLGVPRQLVTLTALDTNASPLGWIHDGANETRGNNVDAHTDRNADDAPDLPRLQGSPARVFDPPFDLGQPPGLFSDAATVNLFYWCNWMHDRLYEVGFDEAAGNFQKDNFGRGGLGGDAIEADAQDGSGVNNANFTPAPDGTPGRIQMFLFNGPEPDLDGDFDAEIILHEYAHGLTTRLVGGGIGISGLQTVGMGEGWSDFYALALLSEADDDLDGAYPFGAYASRQFFGLKENYYFGIRRYPYSTDLSKAPLTFKDIDGNQISPYPSVPLSPIFGFNQGNAGEVHNQGEVWCSALWEVRANLIRRHGFATGNPLVLRLVTDGLKLAPPNPNFLQARDAILLADQVDTGGANFMELWRGFAKRGLGFSAISPDAGYTTVFEAFDLPDALSIQNPHGLFAGGPPGGPFAPGCQTYGLTNLSTNDIIWSAQTTSSWLTLDPVHGTLASHGQAVVTVCLNSNATTLPFGNFASPIVFSNATSRITQSRPGQLLVQSFPSLPYYEGFESGTLAPCWAVSGTGPTRARVTTLNGPHTGSSHLNLDSAGGGLSARNEVTLGLDLGGYTNVVLRFWAKSFGDEPDGPPARPFIDGADFDGVAISADGTHWHEVQGLRRLAEPYTEFIVDLDEAMARHGLEYNGRFRIRFNQFDNFQIPFDGLGLDDVWVTGAATRRLVVQLPERATEGTGLLAGQGLVSVGARVASDTVVTLVSSDPSRVAVPRTVVIPAGAGWAFFDLTLADNAQLDGTERVTISAGASGFYGTGTGLEINDNETVALQVTLPPRAREGDGLLRKQGRLRLNERVSRDVAVQLTASPTGKVAIPSTVLIPAGAKEAEFDLTILDDFALDGSRAVTVTAHVNHWSDGSDTILITDNDVPAWTLNLPALVGEADGVLPKAGLIRLAASLPADLVVSLVSSDVSKLAVPATLVVPAGQFEKAFDLTVVDDQVVDGPQATTVTARAATFPAVSASIRILDDETPTVPYDPVPAHETSNAPLSLVLTWSSGLGEILVNGDFESGDFAGWTDANSGYGRWMINDGKFDPDGPEETNAPFAGKFDAVTTQIGAGRRSLQQDLFIPATASSATLSWSDRIRNHAAYFAEPNQQFRVLIKDTDNHVVARLFETRPEDPPTNDWTRRVFNLSAFRGQVARLTFEQEDNLGYFNTRLDNVSVRLGVPDVPTTFDVYFGMNPTPGPAEFLGRTTNASWTLPSLALNQVYYWQVIAKRGAGSMAGPVWRFTTRGAGAVHHFEWSSIPSPQQAGRAFALALTARDEANQVVKDFAGTVSVIGLDGAASASSIVISEIDTGSSDATELMNISPGPVDMAGWQLTVYDAVSWPQPLTTVTLPSGSKCPPGGIFKLNDLGTAPGRFPEFYAGTNVSWSKSAVGNPIAVLLRDAAGNGVDFVCAGDADPALITHPLPITRSVWTGEAVPVVGSGPVTTLQRIGNSNERQRLNWTNAPASLGRRNTGLSVPFAAHSIALAPMGLTNFTMGVWTGELRVEEVVPQLTLRADDGHGHTGFANEIAVGLEGDAGVALADLPDRVLLGETIRYRVRLTNSGPARATGLLFTNWLPAGMSVVSATTSSGSCTHSGQAVVCAMDPLAGGASAEAVIQARALRVGSFTNEARLVRAEADPYLANNTAREWTAIQGPFIWTTNIFVDERTGMNVTGTFHVRLSAPCTLPVSVRYATEDIEAEAGLDYLPVSGTLIFPPGTTSLPVAVTIIGDTLDESLETFFLNLFDPTNGIIATASAQGRIRDDDPTPILSIHDGSGRESRVPGDGAAFFDVTLSAASSVPVVVGYVSSNGTAVAGRDYEPVFGTLLFPPGTTLQTITVPILNDDLFEPTEVFYIGLFGAGGAVMAIDQATGTIEDDDADALDRFVWSEVPSPQYAGRPFAATITALDGRGRPVTHFDGPVSIQAVANSRESVIASGTNDWEQPLGAFFQDDRAQVIYLPEEIGGAGQINALSLRVTAVPGQTLSNWTLRLKHTPLRRYGSAPAWETNGWTTVFKRDETLTSTGWVVFLFRAPFAYNGSDALLVDFSFNNASYSVNGSCAAAPTAEPRAIYFQTDGAFGDPLDWSGTQWPPPIAVRLVPTVRFTLEDPVPASPSGAVSLVNGIWSGSMTVEQEQANVLLRAFDGLGRVAASSVFRVDSATDADGDGLPESWENRYFGSTNSPEGAAGADPDGDGVTNLEEFRAGSDPRHPASAARILSVQLEGGDVHLHFASVPGKTYRLEWCDRMRDGVWKATGDPVTGSGEVLRLIDKEGAGAVSRFYRVRELP